MMRLEHANLAVRDLQEALRFVTTAFPEMKIRGQGEKAPRGRWIHVGTDETYLALNEALEAAAEPWVPYSGRPGLNHLGFEVADAEAVRRRLLDAGYRESTVPNRHPHRRRVYFHDAEGNDWEFVEYRSDDPAERHDYEIAD